MALQTRTISANGSKGHHNFTLKVIESSTSTSGNFSSVSWSFVLSPVVRGWDWLYQNTVPVTYTITINGVNYTGNIMSYDGESTVTVRSGTSTVAHNADGSKTMNFSFSVSSIDSRVCPGAASASGSMALTPIPRFATITSAPDISSNDNSVTIALSNPAGDAVSELKVRIEGAGVALVPYQSIPKTSTSYTFTFTEAEKAALLNATQGSNSLRIKYVLFSSIDGNYDTYEAERDFYISDPNVTVTGTVEDVNSTTTRLTGSKQAIIKYFSNVKASMTVQAQPGATLDADSYVITNGNKVGYGAEHTFSNVEENTFNFSATDSRGNPGRDTKSFNEMVNYIKLTCNLGNDKPDGNGNMTLVCSGNYFNDSFGAVDNTLTVKYRYKYSTGGWIGGDGSGWHSDMTITKSGNFYYASAALSGFDYRLSYVFECQAEDQLMTVSSGESSPIKSSPIFHWGENDFKFEVPVAVNGDLDISGVLRMGDKEIPIIQHGEWTPYLNYSAVSSYGERYGWYSKVGDKVIVGFYIEATCGSGYDSQTISISGLPFTPMFCAAGGGMCSGAYVGGGYTFQCFVAEPSECITTRVQACNNTSAGNLSASNGVFYPVGGGVIVLAGTISYISYL